MIEVRVAGLWVRDGQVLLGEHERGGERYWVVPGGHVDEGETLVESLVREFVEEIDVRIRVRDLVMVDDVVHDDRHNVNLYFAVEPADSRADPATIEDGSMRGARFVAADELPALDLRPPISAALVEYLRIGRVARTYLGAS